MRRAVVVTVIGALGACGHRAPPPAETVVTNPPAPEAPAPEAPAPEAPAPEPPRVTPGPAAPPGEHDRTRFTTVLNATHAEHGRVYRHRDGGCYVNLPFPPGEGPPVSFRPPPTQVVDCPPEMADPSWLDCAHGTALAAVDDPTSCLCAVMGNPPPPPRPMTCPKREG